MDGEGQFISHTLEHVLPPATRRRKRDIHEDTTLYYHIDIDGEPVHLKLTPNDALFAPGLVVERRRHRAGNVSDSTVHRIHGNTCHFRGHVIDDEESKVSLATCKGLVSHLGGIYFTKSLQISVQFYDNMYLESHIQESYCFAYASAAVLAPLQNLLMHN